MESGSGIFALLFQVITCMAKIRGVVDESDFNPSFKFDAGGFEAIQPAWEFAGSAST